MSDIKNVVGNTIAITFIGLLFLFVLTWIIFDFHGSSNLLKDTWTIVSSLFSGIATLSAAYIASRLFNDWREQANFDTRKEISMSVIELLATMKFDLRMIQEKLFNLKLSENYLFLNTNYREYSWVNLKKEIHICYPKIKYVKRNNFCSEIDISFEYEMLEKHYEQIGVSFTKIIEEYSKYYELMISELNLEKNKEYSQPYDSYEKLKIQKPQIASNLMSNIYKNDGFWVFNGTTCKLIKYENIEDMINKTILILEKIESSLLNICSPSPK